MTDSTHSDGGAHDASRGMHLFLERFPNVREISEQLHGQSEVFRDLCEQHAACTSAIERFAQSPSREALLSEYSALRLQLEGELLRWISSHWSSHGRR